ncbi:helix-turn-helix domain-containing protein [Streptomyces chartreusis]|uniref:helix-turn-helix domain-containing protein n=1 Tax=Streptomyces chartreusis TaxID=1969 RepID=UPI0038118632
MVPQIAEELGCNQKTVYRWLHRFNHSSLEDLGGQGRKRRSPKPNVPERMPTKQRPRWCAIASTPKRTA